MFCCASPVGCIAAMVFTLIASVIKEAMAATGGPSRQTWLWDLAPLFGSIGIAGVFWVVARSIVMAAETAVAKADRIAPNWVRMIEFDLPRHVPRRRSQRWQERACSQDYLTAHPGAHSLYPWAIRVAKTTKHLTTLHPAEGIGRLRKCHINKHFGKTTFQLSASGTPLAFSSPVQRLEFAKLWPATEIAVCI